MSRQIAVRLPSDLVEFVDHLVATEQAPSRAAVIARSLERERRRAIAARDMTILATTPDDPDLDRLAEYVATAPLGID